MERKIIDYRNEYFWLMSHELAKDNNLSCLITLSEDCKLPIYKNEFFSQNLWSFIKNTHAGVYLLTLSGRIVYVGMSMKMRNRLNYHFKYNKSIIFDGIGFGDYIIIPSYDEWLNEWNWDDLEPNQHNYNKYMKFKKNIQARFLTIEKILIEELKPSLNLKHYGG